MRREDIGKEQNLKLQTFSHFEWISKINKIIKYKIINNKSVKIIKN